MDAKNYLKVFLNLGDTAYYAVNTLVSLLLTNSNLWWRTQPDLKGFIYEFRNNFFINTPILIQCHINYCNNTFVIIKYLNLKTSNIFTTDFTDGDRVPLNKSYIHRMSRRKQEPKLRTCYNIYMGVCVFIYWSPNSNNIINTN